MAAKGAEEKQIVIDKIKEVFPAAFEYDKVLRIPIGDVQIKVALTCAKDNVALGGDTAIPGSGSDIIEGIKQAIAGETSVTLTEPSEDEVKAVADLMSALNL